MKWTIFIHVPNHQPADYYLIICRYTDHLGVWNYLLTILVFLLQPTIPMLKILPWHPWTKHPLGNWHKLRRGLGFRGSVANLSLHWDFIGISLDFNGIEWGLNVNSSNQNCDLMNFMRLWGNQKY
jgi:hypothetical protein